MKKMQKANKEIFDLLSQNKWHEAAGLIKSNGVSDDLAFAAIYAGIESDDETLVDQGITAMLNLIMNPSKINPLSDAYFDLGNAYHYKASKYRQKNHTFFGAEEIIKQCIENFHKALALKRNPIIMTNLANLLDEIGRPLEALIKYEEAIREDNAFGMAIGNKAYLLEYVAGITTYQTGYLIYAYQLYEQALKNKDSIISIGGISAYDRFKSNRDEIKKYFSDNNKEQLLERDLTHAHHKTNSKTIERYTEFCLSNDLYLNLHIFDQHSVGSIGDTVSTSLITDIVDKDQKWVREIHMRLNEIKEAYMAGRYTLWLSQQKTGVMSKISEQSLLVNNLDYTAHNLYIGLLKMAYKEVFSVLDKIANFLNYYLKLGNDEEYFRLNYRTIWYKDLNNKALVFHENIKSQDSRLFGLYSLLNELGKAPSDVRNALEHRYKRISTAIDLYDAPTFDEFTQQTTEVYYKVKCAIVYLINFINYTENFKQAQMVKNGGKILSMPLNTSQWLDIWN